MIIFYDVVWWNSVDAPSCDIAVVLYALLAER